MSTKVPVQLIKSLLILLCFFILACSNENANTERTDTDHDNSQYFQGRIIYKYEFESTGLDADSLALLRAKRAEMLIANGNYHFTFFGLDTTIYIYKGDVGNCYFRRSSWEGYRCMDYKVWDDTLKSIENVGEGEEILGLETHRFESEANFVNTVYNLSTKYKLDPDQYSKHASTHFNKVLKAGDGGIALKSIYEFPRFTVIETATDIDAQTIDTTLFHIPDSMVIINCR